MNIFSDVERKHSNICSSCKLFQVINTSFRILVAFSRSLEEKWIIQSFIIYVFLHSNCFKHHWSKDRYKNVKCHLEFATSLVSVKSIGITFQVNAETLLIPLYVSFWDEQYAGATMSWNTVCIKENHCQCFYINTLIRKSLHFAELYLKYWNGTNWVNNMKLLNRLTFYQALHLETFMPNFSANSFVVYRFIAVLLKSSL